MVHSVPRALWRGALAVALLSPVVACADPPEPGRLAVQRALLDDPCTLLLRDEVESLLGPLDTSPFRADERGAPDPAGPTCLYRAASGQSVALTPTFAGGAIALRARAGDPPASVRWLPPGRLLVLDGDVLLEIDVVNATVGPLGAARMVLTARSRLDHPLAYDGGTAARRTTRPRVLPRDPCSVLEAGEVESVAGPLAGAPERIADDGCRYPLPRRGGPARAVELRVVWRDGVAAVNAERAQARDTATPAGPWDVALARPGELLFARHGVAIRVLAPTEQIATRVARRAAARLR